jgi:hypothetical protein
MAVGRGRGGASRAGSCWLAPAPPLLIQGGEFCLALMSLCMGLTNTQSTIRNPQLKTHGSMRSPWLSKLSRTKR